jgi:hypothetical protein
MSSDDDSIRPARVRNRSASRELTRVSASVASGSRIMAVVFTPP